MKLSKKKFVQEKLSKREESDRNFDIEFWQKLGHEAIFSAAWEMIQEVNLIRGKNASQSRLQRDLENIQRRRR